MFEIPDLECISDFPEYLFPDYEVHFHLLKDEKLSHDQIENCDLIITLPDIGNKIEKKEVLLERALKHADTKFIYIVRNSELDEEVWLSDNLLVYPVNESFQTAKIPFLFSFGKFFLSALDHFRSTELNLQERLTELNQIGIALSNETNLDYLLDMILREVRRFTGSDAGSLYIKDGDNLVFKAAQNDTIDRKYEGEKRYTQFRIPISTKSIAGYVAAKKTSLNIEDVSKIPEDSLYQHDTSFDTKFSYKTRSMLTFPMMDNQGEIIGVLQLINALDEDGNPVSFSKTVESLVQSLGSQAAVAIKNAELIDDFNRLLMSLLEYSSLLIDARSRHTAGHSHRVAHLVMEIARAVSDNVEGPFADVSFSENQMQEMYYAALLHDIGKIGVPEAVLDKQKKIPDSEMEALKWRLKYIILNLKKCIREHRSVTAGGQELDDAGAVSLSGDIEKLYEIVVNINEKTALTSEDKNFINEYGMPIIELDGKEYPLLKDEEKERLLIEQGNLTEREREIIKKHANLTIDTLTKIPFPKHLKGIPYYAGHHHEKLDGSGYPRGLTKEEIPLESRILAIADFIDALSAQDRPYRMGVPVQKTMDILLEESKKGLFDIDLAKLIKEKINTGELKVPWFIP